MNDLQLAKEKHQAFKDWRQTNNKLLPYDMVVSVLTTGFWPTYKVRSACRPHTQRLPAAREREGWAAWLAAVAVGESRQAPC